MHGRAEMRVKSDPSPVGRRVIVTSDRFSDGFGLLGAARAAPVCAGARFERLPIADFWRRRDLGPDDLVLVAATRPPDSAGLARWRGLARSVALAFVVPREHIAGFEAIGAARGVGIIAREDLGAQSLETAIRALARARDRERALIDILARRNHVLSEMRIAAQDLSLAESSLTSRFRCAPAGAMNAIAAEAIATIGEAEARMASALADAEAERPSDLVALVDALVRPDGRALDPAIGALTSEGPLWLDAPAREVRALVSGLLARWRAARASDDRLELIVWDAGESARIAAVLSRAAPDPRRAPLVSAARDVMAALQPLARACRARIEVAGEPRGRGERMSLAIHLPKRGVGPGPCASRRRAAPDDLVGQAGGLSGPPAAAPRDRT